MLKKTFQKVSNFVDLHWWWFFVPTVPLTLISGYLFYIAVTLFKPSDILTMMISSRYPDEIEAVKPPVSVDGAVPDAVSGGRGLSADLSRPSPHVRL